MGGKNLQPILKAHYQNLYRWNPYLVQTAVSFLFCLGIWSYSRGKIGFDGKYCVEGFKNEPGVIRYAYRLVTDPKWSKGAEVPDEGCIHSPLTG